jgi:homoserine dehydrogenase
MKYIAILGFGVVGGGIPEVLKLDCAKIKKLVGDDVEVKYILDLRDFPDSPYASKVVHDINIILNDKDIEVVCEVMGGSHPAREFTMECMTAGKSVVTSNKEVVANYGDELLACAKKNGVSYLFEASVGGGIPVLRSFATSLAGEKIKTITGIVNGTTNYILTRMKKGGLSFESALAEAQALGFAEKDPTSDIDGIDAKRKIIILLALATGKLYSSEYVKTNTMKEITSEDMDSAAQIDGEVKLIARAEIKENENVSVCVSPMIVKHSSLLSHISDVFNGISVECETLGEVVFYGRGAGRMPTAGAVAADVCAVLSGSAQHEYIPEFTHASDSSVNIYDNEKYDWCITAKARDEELCYVLEHYDTSVKKLARAGERARVIASNISISEIKEAAEQLSEVRYIRVI